MACGLIRHGHEEREADEAVKERQDTVRADSGDIAPGYQVTEQQRRMTFWGKVFHMNRQEEGEAEEGNDDEVYQADTDCRCSNGRSKRT